MIIYCESCLMTGDRVIATTHSTRPEWSGYNLCEECAAEYNNREYLGEFSTEREDAIEH